MGSFLQDLRYAVRALRHAPGFTVVAILTLALGIGANTAIFSVIDAVLLRPLPYPRAHRLVQVSNQWKEFSGGYVSLPEFSEMRKQTTAFEAMALYRPRAFNWSQDGRPERVRAAEVTTELFSVLQMAPTMGRTFQPDEARDGKDKVVILSEGLWQRSFAADRNVLNQAVRLNGISYSVIGVMPRGFYFPEKDIEAWVPLNEEQAASQEGRLAHIRQVVARLQPGASLQQARAELAAVAAYFRQNFPNQFRADSGFNMTAADLQETWVGDSRTPLLVLLGAVGFVLLIACANVANLFLARATARERELAIRAALGAARGTLLRQLLTESLLLAVLGAGAGLLMAWWGVDLLAHLQSAGVPRLEEVRIDLRVLGFTLGLSLLTGLLFGLAPAWRVSRADLLPALQEGSRGSAGLRHRGLRSALVIAEVGFSVILLAGTALLLRSYWGITQVKPGFSSRGVLAASLSLGNAQYPTQEKRVQFYAQLLERLRNEPGVTGAAAATLIPLTGSNDTLFEVEGRAAPTGAMLPDEQQRVVTRDYFQTLGIPLLRGRSFLASDTLQSPEVVIISESLARKYWKDGNPLRGRIAFGDPKKGAPWVSVVGVVADVREDALHLPARPILYVPHGQYARGAMTVVVRGSGAQPPAQDVIRRNVTALDPDVALFAVRPVEQIVEGSVASQRLNLLLISIFALLALALASVGLYGVMSYLVQQQTRETGIRMAFGASPAEVLRLYFQRGFTLFGAGLAVGLLGAFAVARTLRTLLFEVTPNDPASYAAISIVLAAATALACWIPARRAARTDPMVALRHE